MCLSRANVLALLLLPCKATWAAAGALGGSILESSLVEDSECVALSATQASSGQETQCSLNALQRQALSKKVDLESAEGADLIEAAREWHESNTEEDRASLDLNRSTLGTRDGIPPPRTAVQYNGISWPEMRLPAAPGEAIHFFAIGDWGGMDGSLRPPEKIARMLTYPGGDVDGPHVFPRTRLGCDHRSLNSCFFGRKRWCNPLCGFARGVDDQPQLRVAEKFLQRAAAHDPKLILNVGDNFYWGGIAKKCGHPMNQIHWATQHQFDNIFEGVYRGRGMDGKPWLSVLGNHDWGGRKFTAGWDQQIAYTWASNRWLMPAVYWHQKVSFPTLTADIYMVDTNHHDTEPKYMDINHNICGAARASNQPDSTCAAAGGPANVNECAGWFRGLWEEEQKWLTLKMSESKADWQIVVTHFPCDFSPSTWRELHEVHGLDLLVTGHRHDQELWRANQHGRAGVLGGLTCFVTGGGGGITSEESPLKKSKFHFWPNVDAQYGFFDLTVSKAEIKVESIDHKGDVVASTVVYPKAKGGA